MLTLLLLRHAKAEAGGKVDDYHRDLTNEGMSDGRRLAAFCKAEGMKPEQALVSTSRRTRRTFEVFSDALAPSSPAHMRDDLYNAEASDIIRIIQQVEASCGSLLVVGHNPGINDAASFLARDGDALELQRLRKKFSPCSLAVVTFDRDDWIDACASGGRLDYLVSPEDLPAAT